jgi:hypothetical protein
VFNQQQTELRKTDPTKIVRQWSASPFIYGADSKQRTPNPDAHPAICQREDGKFCDVEGRLIPDSKVPDHIRSEGKPPKATTVEGGEVSLSDAMTDALTPADPRDKPARKPAAKRGRKSK